MIIVGELINGTRQAIAKAVAQRDAKTILNVAQKQVETGAHLLDINAGTDPDRWTSPCALTAPIFKPWRLASKKPNSEPR